MQDAGEELEETSQRKWKQQIVETTETPSEK